MSGRFNTTPTEFSEREQMRLENARSLGFGGDDEEALAEYDAEKAQFRNEDHDDHDGRPLRARVQTAHYNLNTPLPELPSVRLAADDEMDTYERELSRAKASAEQPPDCYINCLYEPLTIDPINKRGGFWVRDDSYAVRHGAFQQRGALKDWRDVNDLLRGLNENHEPFLNYEPTTEYIDTLPKFSARCNANSTRGKVIGHTPGELPVHSQLIYDDLLPRPPTESVEKVMWLSDTHGSRDRTFDCDGWGQIYCR